MKKLFGSLLLAAACFLLGALAAQKLVLERDVVRLHVVAASDSRADQRVKLLVRDAVLKELESVPRGDLERALPSLQAAAEETLKAEGISDGATLTFRRECFETRQGEDCALPAGAYQTLRLTIGAGQGHNWWGVVFPRLCYGETEEAWSGSTKEVRFYFLEKLGQAENWVVKKLEALR